MQIGFDSLVMRDKKVQFRHNLGVQLFAMSIRKNELLLILSQIDIFLLKSNIASLFFEQISLDVVQLAGKLSILDAQNALRLTQFDLVAKNSFFLSHLNWSIILHFSLCQILFLFHNSQTIYLVLQKCDMFKPIFQVSCHSFLLQTEVAHRLLGFGFIFEVLAESML